MFYCLINTITCSDLMLLMFEKKVLAILRRVGRDIVDKKKLNKSTFPFILKDVSGSKTKVQSHFKRIFLNSV